MTITTITTITTAAAELHAVPEPAPATPDRASRIEWLFRDALRKQQVHPLMDLVRRYRAKAGS